MNAQGPIMAQGPITAQAALQPQSLFTHKVAMWTALVVERSRAVATAGVADMEAIIKDAERAVEAFEARFERAQPPPTA